MTTASDQDSTMLREISPKNFLSFGPDSEPVRLGPLNVLIGPNGSGKSNFIEAIAFLRGAPTDVSSMVRTGGGVSECVWKGAPREPACVSAIVSNPHGHQALRHLVEFVADNQVFRLVDEYVENETPSEGQDKPYFFYRFQNGRPMVATKTGKGRPLKRETVEFDQSILSQRKDPELYPEITFLARQYNNIRLYREWSFGRSTVFRQPQLADLRNDRLEEDFSNLGMFLNRLRTDPTAKAAIVGHLRDLYAGVLDFDVFVQGGTVQVFFTEDMFAIPANRLSDGTMRFLCLLAILCDPKPPGLVCIEEPELGLHPDLLPKIADLLLAASNRMQLIVTTHSDIIVDALTERPEAVLVCEKRDGQTVIRRLEQAELSVWTEKYRLGQLWLSGGIGGTRW